MMQLPLWAEFFQISQDEYPIPCSSKFGLKRLKGILMTDDVVRLKIYRLSLANISHILRSEISNVWRGIGHKRIGITSSSPKKKQKILRFENEPSPNFTGTNSDSAESSGTSSENRTYLDRLASEHLLEEESCQVINELLKVLIIKKVSFTWSRERLFQNPNLPISKPDYTLYDNYGFLGVIEAKRGGGDMRQAVIQTFLQLVNIQGIVYELENIIFNNNYI